MAHIQAPERLPHDSFVVFNCECLPILRYHRGIFAFTDAGIAPCYEARSKLHKPRCCADVAVGLVYISAAVDLSQGTDRSIPFALCDPSGVLEFSASTSRPLRVRSSCLLLGSAHRRSNCELLGSLDGHRTHTSPVSACIAIRRRGTGSISLFALGRLRTVACQGHSQLAIKHKEMQSVQLRWIVAIAISAASIGGVLVQQVYWANNLLLF